MDPRRQSNGHPCDGRRPYSGGTRRLLLVACMFLAQAAGAGDYAGLTLQQALERLEAGGLNLVYSSALVRPDMVVTREPASAEPRAMLDEILAPHGLVAKEGPGRSLLLVRAAPVGASAQGRTDRPPPPLVPELGEVVVSASYYRLGLGSNPYAMMLSAGDIALLPELGDDPMRAVGRLPGVARQDFSSRPHIRGGAADETLVRFDDLRLYNPFHLKDFQSLFSTLDPAVTSGLNVYTAGFPVVYGDRMSGVIDVARLEPGTGLQGQLALSLLNASGLLRGVANGDRTDWLVSARRGNLDAVLSVVDPDLGRPSYHDAHARVGQRLGDDVVLSANLLVSRDDLTVFDRDQEERATAEYRDEYYWLRLDYDGPGDAGGRILAARTQLASERLGSADLPGVGRGTLEDRRAFSIDSLQADGWLPLASRSTLQAGVEWRRMRGRYDYRDEAEFDLLFLIPGAPDAPTRSRDLSARPRGEQYGAYLNWRVEPLPSLTADAGLRWDRETLSEAASARLSPRLGLMWEPRTDTRLRVAWGRFFQAQGIDELPVADGETRFHPAQRADHLVAGIERGLAPALQLRVEAYRKRYRDLRPRYENLFDTLVVLPELKPDRARIAPSEAEAWGIEATLDYDGGDGLEGWLSYSWSSVTDELGGADTARNWDQPSYLSAGLHRRSGRWDFSLAASWHSGWPTTGLELVATEPVPLVAAGRRNARRLGSYGRLDARIARQIEFESRGSLTVFFEIHNLTNRRNDCCTEYQIEDETGEPVLDVSTRQALLVVPSVGFVWDF